MNQSALSDAATSAAKQSKTFIVQQVDRQAKTLAQSLEQAARDLEQMETHLRESGAMSPAAQVVDTAVRYVNEAARYLEQNDSERYIADLESWSRQRPWAVTAATAALGFMAARVLKSSSARRYSSTDYGSSPYGSTYTSTGSSYSQGATGRSSPSYSADPF